MRLEAPGSQASAGFMRAIGLGSSSSSSSQRYRIRQHLVASGGRVGAAAGQDVAEEVFEVGLSRFLELLASSFQKVLGQPGASR